MRLGEEGDSELPKAMVEGCPLPEDLLYDLELDVWARPELGGEVVVFGVMAPLASFAGKFLALRFRPLEGSVERGQSVATVESLRLTQAIRTPVSGLLLSQNDEVARRPKLLNDDPYARGWVARVKLPKGIALPPTLRAASEVREEVRRKIQEMHIRCYLAVPDVELYEIGSECSAVFAHLDDEIARRAPDEVVLLVADDPTAPIEMERWRMRSGHSVLHDRKEGNLHHFLVRKERDPRPERRRA